MKLVFDPDQKRSQLKWQTPVPGPECTPEDGLLRITVPPREGGYDLWVESIADAPVLRAKAPAGDWDLSARLKLAQAGEGGSFHIGLVVGFAKGLACIFGPYKEAPKITRPELRVEATGIPALARKRVDCSTLDLRVSKRDNCYTCSYRAPGAAGWTRAGEHRAAFPPKFVGIVARTFGSGAGLAFSVSDLAVKSVRAKSPVAAIRVDARASLGKINRDIYGHFIEHLGRCINEGIWAEMLWNRKFTGGVDERGVIEWWSAFGEGATYSRDNTDFYTSCQSQRIELAAGKEAGILKKDAHLGIKPGKYVVRAILKQQGLRGGVTVALRQGQRVHAAAEIPKLTGEWAEYGVELDVKERDPDAQFSLSAVGPGRLWVGCLSLMPADNVEGMRKDVLDTIRKLKPPLIRWPGGNMVSGYHWEDGLGQRDQRMPRWERAWNSWEWNDFGTDEYMRFCRLVGTAPYICVNAGEAHADEAARWVEYCNGPADSPYGSLRAANGHPEPWGVKFWAIGNEMYGDWQLGHIHLSDYVKKHTQFAVAMKAMDPSVQLVAVGAVGRWSETMLAEASNHMDLISEHFYVGHKPGLLSHVNQMPNEIRRIAEAHRKYRAAIPTLKMKEIPVALDEWNYWYGPHVYGELGTQYFLEDALGVAAGLNEFARQSDVYFMANYAQTVNVIGAIKTSKTAAVLDTTGVILALYRKHFGTIPVAVGGAPEPLDIMACWLDETKSVLTLSIVNPTGTAVTLRLDAGRPALPTTARLFLVGGLDPRACNVPGQPPAVAVHETGAAPFGKKLMVPPISVSLYQIGVGPQQR